MPSAKKQKHEVLIVDDDRGIRAVIKDILEGAGYIVEEAQSGEEALEKIKNKEYAVIVCDLKMPGMDGLAVLKESRNIRPNVPMIMLTAFGTIETAVKAIKMGAFEFLVKPPDIHQMLVAIRNAIEQKQIKEERDFYRSLLSEKEDLPPGYEIIGESPQIKKVKELIGMVAPTDARVLITGPNGSGKELVARNIHIKSKRAKGPFITVNCAAIPSELIESELFGHEKGAFTSAHRARKGKFELANGGTIFLDEIGDMSLAAQAKVLRVIETGEVTPVGSETTTKVNVRIIAATNKDLETEIKEKRFREDLYHRLNVVQIKVPPLDERKEDIPLLVEHFIKVVAARHGLPAVRFSEASIQALQERSWPGNVRELHNAIEKALILLNGKDPVTPDDLKKLEII